ncbi:fer-1-like protein 4 [Periophthalmus magnuspinnatus]|uniref:fer-1-like protein 4 n=1 Tax=Periophthalmus magnuspinnatus TaxID=409849 RepID=UPI00145BF961|nr:fer-1-like protein 4 [Periophthalmus magnuspinnatus]XP_055081067.1 fer-1-like protein 4 [Periophthalmus magnuspinnatus]
MSISVTLRKVWNLPGRSDRKVTLKFRGFSHKTRILQSEDTAVFNEYFRWPHYGKLSKDEVLSVCVYNCSRIFSNRLLGQLEISLQHVLTSGRLILREPLTDANYSLTDIYIELDIRYHLVQGAAGNWDGQDFIRQEDTDDSLVIINDAFDDIESQLSGIRSSQLEREVRRLGRELVTSGDDEFDSDEDWDEDYTELESVTFTQLLSRCRALSKREAAAAPRVHSFQISVNVLEAQKLLGVNINPVVFIQVGNHKRHTATQKSTNCPYYNENFVFELQESPEMLFDKVIEIKVCHRKTLPFLLDLIGLFRMDIKTVFNQPDQRFYQQWAPLCDPTDTRSGVKGYVRATVGVLMKGDRLGTSIEPGSHSNGSPEIEKNLMLPRGMSKERPWARFRVRIYRAEGLPTMDSGLMAKIAVSDRTVFIDPYVQVTFCGQQGETSVAGASSCPVWNEEISFIEQFPPLAQRIRIQVLDDAKTGDVALATHFLDLQQISDPTRNGFNPTFGPSWVNLYGSPQNSTLRDIHQALNEGLGEGIFYRGRILIALSVEVYSSPSPEVPPGPVTKVKGALGKQGLKKKRSSQRKNHEQSTASLSEDSAEDLGEVPEAVTVETEEIHPLPEGFLGEKQEFVLFASLFEVTMMDASVGNKLVNFELSIGTFGKAVEVVRKRAQSREELRGSRQELSEESQGLLESEEDLDRPQMPDPELDPEPEPENHSVTEPMKAECTEYDRSFRCIPFQSRPKPCLWVLSRFEDHSPRLHQSSWLHKISDRLELGLEQVERLMRRPGTNAKNRLQEALLELIASCKQFSVFSDRRSQFRPNTLDRCRKDFIKKNLVILARQAVRIRRRITKRNIKLKLTDARKILRKLRLLAHEPQSTLPDVLLWLRCGRKRLAYVRIPAYSILFSMVEEQKGRDCGHVSTFYMKLPGSAPGEVFAKLEVYLWLGQSKYSKEAVGSLPEDFTPVRTPEEGMGPPTKELPLNLACQDSRYFQLRCHLYQGRSLLAADDNGLSDPFAKVLFSTQCQVSKVVRETLSPAWSQCLLFDRVLLEGSREELELDPPLVIINIYDQDAMGSPRFLGRAYAEPQIKRVEELYSKPQLKFYDVSLGKASAGELLAAFELIEFDYSALGEPRLPRSLDPQELEEAEDRTFLIPEGVRPVLKTFRIEVLFWGLRDLKRVQLFEVERPLVIVECSGKTLESEEVEDYKSQSNFKDVVRYLDVELPELVYLHPPLTLFVVERRALGRLVLVGSHLVHSLMSYGPKELGAESDHEEEGPIHKVVQKSVKVAPVDIVGNLGLSSLNLKQSKIKNPLKVVSNRLQKEEELEEEPVEQEELDWWSKYYASIQERDREAASQRELEEQAETDGANLTMANIEDDEEEMVVVETEPPKRKNIATLTLYSGELESQFHQFQDWLQILPLFKGRALGDALEEEPEERIMGKFKGSFLVYPIDPEADTPVQITDGIPKNSPVKVLVRVYIIKASSLSPTDPNGKADPYLLVQVGTQSQDSKDRYIPKQLNPVFGEVFEFTISFPLETELLVKILDHDLVGADDVIGETRLDLENRFYSRHRASCGLPLYYDTEGYNMWRDAKKPSTILTELCQKHIIPDPEFRTNEVKVLNKIFKIPPDAIPEALLKQNQLSELQRAELEEHMALNVLHRWAEMREFIPGAVPLVPEHVEIRPLVNSDKPGLPQGFLHMWVDVFPTDVPAPPPVNIKPRLPVQYELRVIIWNTDDVFLDDINPFTGEPSSDIYVKGWIKGLEGEKQETDVHFNSLTGEGNFNWRFVFRFDYLPTEKEVVYKKKESIFSLEEAEFRQPAVLTLQVWDYDRILANDFLGSIELSLFDMVRPARSASKCSVKMSKDQASPRVSIFRSRKLKGWWPLTRLKTAEDFEREEKEQASKKKKNKKDRHSQIKSEDLQFIDANGATHVLMGKVEAELQLVTLEAAEANPVGKARKEPEPLDKPDRPTTSFSWFLNPMKTFVFLIWKNYKMYIIGLLILIILTLFLVLIIYTLPQNISSLIVNG